MVLSNKSGLPVPQSLWSGAYTVTSLTLPTNRAHYLDRHAKGSGAALAAQRISQLKHLTER